MCNFWLPNTRVTSVANDYSEHKTQLFISNRQCTITIISNKCSTCRGLCTVTQRGMVAKYNLNTWLQLKGTMWDLL